MNYTPLYRSVGDLFIPEHFSLRLIREQLQETRVDVECLASSFHHFKESFRRDRFQMDCRSLAFCDPGVDNIANPAIGMHETSSTSSRE